MEEVETVPTSQLKSVFHRQGYPFLGGRAELNARLATKRKEHIITLYRHRGGRAATEANLDVCICGGCSPGSFFSHLRMPRPPLIVRLYVHPTELDPNHALHRNRMQKSALAQLVTHTNFRAFRALCFFSALRSFRLQLAAGRESAETDNRTAAGAWIDV